MNSEILTKHEQLSAHPMYLKLNNIENIRTFMKYHVFAVWDFMSLLKALQKKITCVELPWRDSNYNPELVRLINEIVLGEESDIDQNGKTQSHFRMYLNAMREIGADTSLIDDFLKDFDFEKLPVELKNIVTYHLDIAFNAETHQIASSFFFGREKLIPDMFQGIVDVLKYSNMDCPSLIYYLQRHIELDGDEHGPKALSCLKELIDTDQKKQEVIDVAIGSLKKRWELWDFILNKMES